MSDETFSPKPQSWLPAAYGNRDAGYRRFLENINDAQDLYLVIYNALSVAEQREFDAFETNPSAEHYRLTLVCGCGHEQPLVMPILRQLTRTLLAEEMSERYCLACIRVKLERRYGISFQTEPLIGSSLAKRQIAAYLRLSAYHFYYLNNYETLTKEENDVLLEILTCRDPEYWLRKYWRFSVIGDPHNFYNQQVIDLSPDDVSPAIRDEDYLPLALQEESMPEIKPKKRRSAWSEYQEQQERLAKAREEL